MLLYPTSINGLLVLSIHSKYLHCTAVLQHEPLVQFYSASFTEDIRRVVVHVASLFPSSRLYACGWSLGANILVNYVAEVSRWVDEMTSKEME